MPRADEIPLTVHLHTAASIAAASSTLGHMDRMPPVSGKHVVPVHAVARMLGWSAQRVRRADDILRPTIVSDRSRLYDVDRVLYLVQVMDNAPPVRRPITLRVKSVTRSLRHRYRNRSVHFIVQGP